MMRKCHLNTCPVGVATQDPELRKRFTGNADHVVNLFKFMTEELREIMAELGFRTVNEMVGQVDCLEVRENIKHWKYRKLDLSPILYKEPAVDYIPVYIKWKNRIMAWTMCSTGNCWKLQNLLWINKQKVTAAFPIKNTDRTIGTILSNEIIKKYKGDRLA